MEPIASQSILRGRTTPLNKVLLNKAFEEIAYSTASENIALIFEENGVTRKHTYSELDAFTNRLARSILQTIKENNLSKNNDGDCVIGVSMQPSDYLVATLLAIWKTGAAYLPLDSSFPQQRVEHIVQEAKPTLVICDDDAKNFESTFKLCFSRLINNCTKVLSKALDDTEYLTASQDEIAIILYTSGSTGVPKGVRLSHKNVINRLQWQFRTFPYSKTETIGIFKTALTFVDSVSEIWGPLLNGLSVLVVPKSTTQNPEKLVHILEKYKIERLVLVPSLLSALLSYFQIDSTQRYLPDLRTWVCSGETLLKSLVIDFYKYFPGNEYRLCNFYGSTEIMGDVTYHVISNVEQLDEADKIPIGLPIDNTIMYLLDSKYHPVEPGDVGELFAAGLNVTAGYVNGRDPEKFIENPLTGDPQYSKLYRTGDFARVQDGVLLYEGRTDSQIKIRGHRVDISEVENAVNAINGVDKAAVLCYKLGEPHQTLLAFVTTNISLTEHEIENSLKKTLMGYMVPRVILIGSMPLLVNGKIDRKLLLKNYEDLAHAGLNNHEQEYDFTGISERKTKAAKALFETVTSVLDYPTGTISAKTNFYDIGGTSLNSISTIIALKDKEYHISIEDFLTAVNLGEVINRMSSEKVDLEGLSSHDSSYSTELLSEEHEKIIAEMIAIGFCTKSGFSQYFGYSPCYEIINSLWPELIRPEYSEHSFVVKNEFGKIVAVSINFDLMNEPEINDLGPRSTVVMEFLEGIDKPMCENYISKEKGKTLHSFIMATDWTLSSNENVALILYMEEEVHKMAKVKDFETILTTNTSPLTYQLCTDVFGYETLADVQANRYVHSDGTKPFAYSDDSWRVYAQKKTVKKSNSEVSILKGATCCQTPTSLHKIFEGVANSPAANNVALLFEGDDGLRKHLYSELDAQTNSLARFIRQTVLDHNLSHNDDGDYVIAVSMNPSDNLVIALLSIWKTGAAYLPLDAAFPKDRVEHILQDAKPTMIIYDEDYGNFGNTLKIPLTTFIGEGNNFSSSTLSDEERVSSKPDDIAIILYTSGSTGIPKGVRLSHTAVLNRLQWQFKVFPYTNTETAGIFKTALTFVDSISEIWGPLLCGLSVVIVPKATTQDPEKLVNILVKYKIERLVLVPSLLRSLLMYFQINGAKKRLPHLTTWVCSGETLTTSLAVAFYKYFPGNQYRLCNFYGSTEIMGDVTYYIVPSFEELYHSDKIPIGTPIDNTNIYLLDDNLQAVDIGEIGELFVSGLNLATGYVNGKDSGRFIENPLITIPSHGKLYRTGDFARVHKGLVLYEGRTDSQIKVRGHRVDLSEVEKAVYSIQGVEKAAVLCYKPGELNQTVLAFVIIKGEMSERQIETELKTHLTSYMMPQVIIVEQIPLLVNGKIDRQFLLRIHEFSSTNTNGELSLLQDIDYTGIPQFQMEAAKVLFETVLSSVNVPSKSAISVASNFYEIGGNSLNSIFTISALSKKGYNIGIGDFISAANLGEVLHMILQKKESVNQNVISERYTVELLREEHKLELKNLLAASFFHKADLERYIPNRCEADYKDLIETIWEPLLAANLSFCLKTETGEIVAATLNFDARDEPAIEIHSCLVVVLEFLDSLESPFVHNGLPSGKGKLLHNFMMGTHSRLSANENIAVIHRLEEEVIAIAERRNFEGILTTNTNLLTQQLATDVYSYTTLLDCQVNKYIASNNTRPFALAPDSQRVLVQWKRLHR